MLRWCAENIAGWCWLCVCSLNQSIEESHKIIKTLAKVQQDPDGGTAVMNHGDILQRYALAYDLYQPYNVSGDDVT